MEKNIPESISYGKRHIRLHFESFKSLDRPLWKELNTSPTNWFSDLKMEDSNLVSHCHTNSFDGNRFLSRDIASALQGHNLQQTLSGQSYSYHTCNSPAYDIINFERPTKQVKTTSLNSSITQQFSQEPSPSCISSYLAYFDYSRSSPPLSDASQFYGFHSSLKPTKHEMPSSQFGNVNMQFSPPSSKCSSENLYYEPKTSHGIKRSLSSTRTSGLTQDLILAERKRREKLRQRFIALAALVPGLKKTDKASVLGDAIMHVKKLQERLSMLEGQTKKRTVESVVFVKKSPLSSDDDNENLEGEGVTSEALPEVEARVSEKEVLLRIHCQKQKGIVVKILTELRSSHLFAVNISVLPFGDSTLDITIIAEMEEDYSLTTKDLIKNLRMAISKFM